MKLLRFSSLAKAQKIAFVSLLALAFILACYFLVAEYIKRKWDSGADAYRRADYSAAAKQFKNLPLPQDEGKLSMYAQVMHASGNKEKAKLAYEKLSLNGNNVNAQVQLGNIALQSGDNGLAISSYEKAISLNPGYVQAYVNLASVHRMQGHVDVAAEALKRGIANNPNSSSLYGMLVETLAGQPESSEYRGAIEALKRLDPKHPSLSQS